jgi:hypothetical protein
MPHFDPNRIATKTLREALRRHDRAEEARSLAYRKAWRLAGQQVRDMGEPRKWVAPRSMRPRMTPEELARIGRLDGLTD